MAGACETACVLDVLCCVAYNLAKDVIDLHGKLVHICVTDDAQAADLNAIARRHGARVVDRRVDAQILVVSDIGAAGQKAAWAAALIGATVMSTQRLLTAGQVGPYVAHKAAVRIRRWIWMSDDFKARHPAISQIVVDAAATRPSLWRLLLTQASFKDKSSASASDNYVMAIVTTREKKQAGRTKCQCWEQPHEC